MFLYYANEESDDVIGGSTKTVQHSIKNFFRNTGALFFKLGTRNVHHKREMYVTYCVVAMATLSAPVSFCKKTNMPICNLLSRTEVLARNTIGSHIAFTIPNRLL